MTQISPASSATAGASPAVDRFHCPGLALTTLDHGRLCELHLTLTPLPGERWAEACRRLHSVLRDEGATIAWWLAFGNVSVRDDALAGLKREFGKVIWPVTWSEGADLAGGGWSGVQVLAVRGVNTEPVEVAGEILACRYFHDEYARRVLLGSLGPVLPRMLFKHGRTWPRDGLIWPKTGCASIA